MEYEKVELSRGRKAKSKRSPRRNGEMEKNQSQNQRTPRNCETLKKPYYVRTKDTHEADEEDSE
jgi:hypothetical protein